MMDERCYEILTELDAKHPAMISFDLTDGETVTALRTLRAAGYIRLYMDGDAEITGAGLAALAAERGRREAAAAQATAEAAAEAGSSWHGVREGLGGRFRRSAAHFRDREMSRIIANKLPVEKGAVQLMTEDVCAKQGYQARKTYTDQVDALRDFHRIIFPRTDDYTFAKSLIDRSPFGRYNYIKNEIDTFRRKHPNMLKDVRERLDVIEKVLVSEGVTA